MFKKNKSQGLGFPERKGTIEYMREELQRGIDIGMNKAEEKKKYTINIYQNNDTNLDEKLKAEINELDRQRMSLKLQMKKGLPSKAADYIDDMWFWILQGMAAGVDTTNIRITLKLFIRKMSDQMNITEKENGNEFRQQSRLPEADEPELS